MAGWVLLVELIMIAGVCAPWAGFNTQSPPCESRLSICLARFCWIVSTALECNTGQ